MPGKARQPIPKGGLDWQKHRGTLARLRANPTLWREVERRLTSGESTLKVARWLLSEHKVEGTTEKNLKDKLGLARKKLAPLDVVPPERVPRFVREKQAELERGSPLLEHLYWLRRQQERRIRQARKTEQKLPVTMRQLTEDIDLGRRIERDIVDLSMELGISKRAPMQIQAAHVGLYADVVRLPVESRERVLRAAEAFLKRHGAGPNGEGEGDRALRGQGQGGEHRGLTDAEGATVAMEVVEEGEGGDGKA